MYLESNLLIILATTVVLTTLLSPRISTIIGQLLSCFHPVPHAADHDTLCLSQSVAPCPQASATGLCPTVHSSLLDTLFSQMSSWLTSSWLYLTFLLRIPPTTLFRLQSTPYPPNPGASSGSLSSVLLFPFFHKLWRGENQNGKGVTLAGYDEARKALKTHAQMYFNVYLEKGGRILHEVLSRRIWRGSNL